MCDGVTKQLVVSVLAPETRKEEGNREWETQERKKKKEGDEGKEMDIPGVGAAVGAAVGDGAGTKYWRYEELEG
jgi:hypothetical protein